MRCLWIREITSVQNKNLYMNIDIHILHNHAKQELTDCPLTGEWRNDGSSWCGLILINKKKRTIISSTWNVSYFILWPRSQCCHEEASTLMSPSDVICVAFLRRQRFKERDGWESSRLSWLGCENTDELARPWGMMGVSVAYLWWGL